MANKKRQGRVPCRSKLTVDLPTELARRIRAYAGAEGLRVSHIVEKWAEQGLAGWYFAHRTAIQPRESLLMPAERDHGTGGPAERRPERDSA